MTLPGCVLTPSRSPLQRLPRAFRRSEVGLPAPDLSDRTGRLLSLLSSTSDVAPVYKSHTHEMEVLCVCFLGKACRKILWGVHTFSSMPEFTRRLLRVLATKWTRTNRPYPPVPMLRAVLIKHRSRMILNRPLRAAAQNLVPVVCPCSSSACSSDHNLALPAVLDHNTASS